MRIRVLVILTCALPLAAKGVVADDSQLFSRIDANSDGHISADEITVEGKPLYTRLLRVSDKNRDGKLTKEEFDAGLKAGSEKFEMSTSAMTGGQPGGMTDRRPGGDMQANLQQMLANIDRDKNGKISESESPPRLKANFKQFDKDSDGELDPREMGAAMMQMRPGAGNPQRPGQGNRPRPEQPKK